MNDSLIAFVLARIADTEQVARAAERCSGQAEWESSEYGDSVYTADTGSPVVIGPFDYLDDEIKSHIVYWDPARVLAEMRVRRLVLAEVERGLRDDPTSETDSWMLRLLALPDADHPGYRPEWRPRELGVDQDATVLAEELATTRQILRAVLQHVDDARTVALTARLDGPA